MREEKVGKLTQFRCHIGHLMTAEVLASAEVEILERDISSVLRMLNERAALCRELAERARTQGKNTEERKWMAASKEATDREAAVRTMTEAEWLRPESSDAERGGGA